MHEVERKYEAPGGARVFFDDVATLGEAQSFTLRATYLDTPDHRLNQAGWLLRRRGGGHDAGWHLKRPLDADTRTEQQWPDAARVPEEARALVSGSFGNVPLVPVVTLVTERTERPVSLEGREVALLASDHVVGSTSGRETVWGELEVELVADADPALLDVLEAPLLAGGFVRGGHASKFARVLAGAEPYARPAGPDAPARDVLLAYLGKQVGTLQSLEAPVRADARDAVHKARVATRRLRSLLRTFEPLLDTEWAEDLRAELRWLGEALGAPRDAEVLREEFGDLLAELGPESLEGPVARRLLDHLSERHDAAHAALREAMDTPRYGTLHDSLVDLLVAAPWRPEALASAGEVLPPLVQAARARVARLEARASLRPDDLARWHEVRKTAKAVRYCTEALADAFGPGMRATADAWTEVTESFGVLQDAVVAHALLAEVGALAEAAGEPTRTYRVLHQAQDDRAAAALVEGRRVLEVVLQD